MDLCSLSQLLDDLKQTEAYLKAKCGLTYKEAAMLCSIEQGNSEPAKLAKSLNLSPSRTSRLISALESKQLTIRKACVDDKRIIKLKLSKSGLEMLDTLHQTELPFPEYIQKTLLEIDSQNK
jgi:DNA-binding MarR family transcriptional regulator